MRRSGLLLFLFLILPTLLFADVITPLSYYTLPLLIPVILLESAILWLLSRKWLGGIRYWKALVIAIVSNLASSLVGLAIPLYKNRTENLMWVGLAFVLSVLIEWGIYIPFIRQKPKVLLGISGIANMASYTLIIALSV